MNFLEYKNFLQDCSNEHGEGWTINAGLRPNSFTVLYQVYKQQDLNSKHLKAFRFEMSGETRLTKDEIFKYLDKAETVWNEET